MRRSVAYLLVGAVAGFVGGLVVGFLFAPQSGAQTRRRIADEAHFATERAREFAERAEHAAEGIGDRVEHYLGRDQEVAWRKVREIREGMQRYTEAHGPDVIAGA